MINKCLPSRLYSLLGRDAFGNLRVDEMDADVAPSDHFSVVLEAISYNNDDDGSTTLGGVYGAAGSGGTVVTGKLEFDAENGVFLVEYVPFVAGTHLLNVTFQVTCEVELSISIFSLGVVLLFFVIFTPPLSHTTHVLLFVLETILAFPMSQST